MERDQELWLDHHAVTCRVFRGRWSVRHCFRIYSEIKDLRIRMSTRAKGKVTHYHSAYNPCEHCPNLQQYIKNIEQIQMDATSRRNHYYREVVGL